MNLQASSGEVYVNLGAHYRWLEKPASWEGIKEYECAFRARLVDFAANQLFSLKDEASVAALVEMMKLEGLVFFDQLEPEHIAKTTKALAREGYQSFVPLGIPAGPATWAKVAAHLGDAASKKRFEAQELRETRAREKEQAEESAAAVEMTYSDYRAAKKAGKPLPKVLRLVFDTFDTKPKKAAKKKPVAKKAKKGTETKKATSASKVKPASRRRAPPSVTR